MSVRDKKRWIFLILAFSKAINQVLTFFRFYNIYSIKVSRNLNFLKPFFKQ